MARTSRKHFALFAVSAALVTGGALVPTSAFAAQAAPHAAEVYTTGVHAGTVGKKDRDGKGRSKDRPRDIENMPGCKFYQGKVYCERKPDTPNPAPKPAPVPDPGKAARENPDGVPAPDVGGFGTELKP
ncbi:hypothetical protein ACXNSR_36005 [Streptomyces sp. NC-S4]